MRRIADSFSWPFRAPASVWTFGVAAVLLLPVGFPHLLGYAVAATRAAALDPSGRPPRWTFNRRAFVDGALVALAVAVTVLPFAAALLPLAGVLRGLGPVSGVVALFVLALPWGLVALLILPHALARFANNGDVRDLFDFASSLRGVRRDFVLWNTVVAAIVTAWALGLACAGLLCVGIVPGTVYAILVSAHACAALAQADGPRQGRVPSPR